MAGTVPGEITNGGYCSRGTILTATVQDNCWYRGKAVGQRGKLVEVYFVDFGNTDKVDTTDVLALPAEFGGLETQVN